MIVRILFCYVFFVETIIYIRTPKTKLFLLLYHFGPWTFYRSQLYNRTQFVVSNTNSVFLPLHFLSVLQRFLRSRHRCRQNANGILIVFETQTSAPRSSTRIRIQRTILYKLCNVFVWYSRLLRLSGKCLRFNSRWSRDRF